MNRQRLLVVVAIAVAVIGAGVWLLWPTAKDSTTSAATAGPYLVRVVGDPPKVGVGTLTVEVSGDGRAPESVTFEPAMPQMGHAATPVAATQESPGRYRADVDLSMPGQWEITVRIAAAGQVHEAVLSVTTSG
ncbi:FixH family protein [Mycobacterium sp. URHB0044]|jgi:hypothetical protein|uniref:FixH family protein n=1 Tax=Mycobacterium sp. URHB0044 TaxID=1380386 RepID=UPI000687B5E9|nr:FixH family protein [Mycobacterium sp. URHB0044]